MSHKNEIKKAEEKFHFEIFKRLFTEFSLSDRDTCRENPDFLLDSLHGINGIIGIEHTRVFEDKTIKDSFMSANKYGDQNKILKKARIICEKKKIPPLWVRVLFSISNLQYTRKDVERISKSLADCIEKKCAQNPSTDKIILRKDELPEIQRIDIVKGLGYQWWQVISAQWVTREFIKEIQKCINDKNSLYAKYRKHCEQCWLLIVADRSKPSQCFELSEKTAKHTYKSAFDRTFYLDLRFEQLVQLSCTKISSL